jgi:hypothetical protein
MGFRIFPKLPNKRTFVKKNKPLLATQTFLILPEDSGQENFSFSMMEISVF